MKSSVETYTLPCVKQIASGNSLYAPGSSREGSVMTWRAGMGREVAGRFRRDGAHVDLWFIHVDVWQKHNIVKQLSSN